MTEINQILKEKSGTTTKQMKIPAIFLKQLIGEYYINIKQLESKHCVKIQFNKNHVTDDCYPIHFMTNI